MDEEALSNNKLVSELLHANGIPQHAPAEEEHPIYPDVHRLEMFFFGVPAMYGYHLFPNLTHLYIINQNVIKIDCLKNCIHLRELWICETAVEKIEGLEQCKKLQHLYLYGNRISRIENILHLNRLKSLSLADNCISRVEGLQNLRELLELNLANNNIASIGESLLGNISIVTLNLSGNPIITFDTLKALKSAAFLISLSLADAQYSPCPLAKMRNYTTLVLFHFPRLKYLDNFAVTEKLVKTAKEIIENKKLYYKLRLRKLAEQFRTFRQELFHIERSVTARVYALRHKAIADLGVLESLEDDVTRSIFSADFDTALFSVDESNIRGKLDAFLTCVDDVITGLQAACQRAVTTTVDTFQLSLSRLELEFSTAGNIEFIPGASEQDWYKACVDLLSPSPPDRVHQLGVLGLTAQSVYQVKNPPLHARFEHKLLTIAGRNQRTRSEPNPNQNILSTVDYLFLQSSVEINQSGMHAAFCKEGLPYIDTSRHLSYFTLTHSVYEADLPRLAFNTKSPQIAGIKQGHAMLCKVFLGRSKQLRNISEVKQVDFNLYNSAVISKYSDTEEFVPDCYCDDQRIFLIPDRDLIVPEYLVSFEYKMKVDSQELVNINQQAVLKSLNSPIIAPLHASINEEFLNTLYSPLNTIQCPVHVYLRDSLQPATSLNPSSVTSLYLPACDIESIRSVNQFPNLTALCLASNNISSISELLTSKLQYLDISYNSIECIDLFRPHSAITTLNLSWNKITDIHSTLSRLNLTTPSLRDLSLYMNPFSLPTQAADITAKQIELDDWIVMQTLVSFPDLRTFNTTPVEEFNVITNYMFNEHSPQLPQECTSTVDSSTELTLFSYSPSNSKSSMTTHDYKWHLAITTLSLQGRGVQALPIDFKLPNLRYADFSHNSLTSLHGLSNCTSLIELNLDWNSLTTIQGLDSLPHLQDLSCSFNRITSLPRFPLKHVNLLSLVLNHNMVTSLQNSNAYTALLDLSLIANPIQSQREILYLKQNTALIVLNISGIELLKNNRNIRYFCFFHLPNIRCFNDELVKTNDLIQAREMYGGKLALSTISERIGHSNFSNIKELSLVNQNIKSFDLDPIEALDNLRSLNLENNQLTSLEGLLDLNRLRILCANNNKITSLDTTHDNETHPVLTSLHVLQLASNGIAKLSPLQLHRLPSLKALFMQNNDVSTLEGFEEFPSLIELVLDRNKVKYIADKDLTSLKNILELHLEENRLKFLPDLSGLVSVHRLFLANNRIHELKELAKLTDLPFLIEVSFINNPISRKANYTTSLIQAVPHIRVIDRCDIPNEERARALDELNWNPM